jgi:AAA15 family ATPase/GTPase
MIKSLRIDNFRGIKSANLTDFSRINLFIGPNNVGKTTILESFLLSSAAIQHSNFFGENILSLLINRKIYRPTSSSKNLWYGYSQNRNIYFRFDLTYSNLSIRFTNNERWIIKSKIFPENLSFVREKNKDILDIKVNDEVRQSIKSKELIESLPQNLLGEKEFKYFLEVQNYLKNLFIIDSSSITKFPLIEQLIFFEIYKTRKDKEIVKILNDSYNLQIENILFGPSITKEPSLLISFPNETIRIDELGEGFRVALMIFFLIYGLQMKIVLIEELENHQHPKALKSLAKALVKFSVQQDSQIFITTHSIDVINSFVDSAEKNSDIIRIFNIERNDGIIGTSKNNDSDASYLNSK